MIILKRKLVFTAALVIVILFSGTIGSQFVGSVRGNPKQSTSPVLAMPEEYVNYTITRVNETFWAKIDGVYPIYLLRNSNDTVQCEIFDELPMVYPTPPGTTNISIRLNGTELPWSNYTEAYPDALHHTAIGDWPMILATISPVSDYFLLTIHYEHPLTIVNGSYLFLYDLNISPYLSPLSNSSEAYFTIRFETEVTNIRAYTTKSDSIWNDKNFTESNEAGAKSLTIHMNSVFNEPLEGDLVVMFSDLPDQGSREFWYWMIIFVLLVAIVILVGIVFRSRSPR
jgi:hypothetical protein